MTEATIGERIRDEREWMGFTRAELAMAVKLTEADITEFEEDARTPVDDELERLAKFFRLDSVDRLHGEPLKTYPELDRHFSERITADDRYEVQRFAEFLRNAGPPANAKAAAALTRTETE